MTEHWDVAGQAIRRAREALNASQSSMAEKAGFREQTWRNAELGKRSSLKTIEAIERALDWRQGAIRDIVETGELPPEPPKLTTEQRLARLERQLSAVKRHVRALSDDSDLD